MYLLEVLGEALATHANHYMCSATLHTLRVEHRASALVGMVMTPQCQVYLAILSKEKSPVE